MPISQATSWNAKGEGFFWTAILKALQCRWVTEFGILKGDHAKALLEITNLLTFVVLS